MSLNVWDYKPRWCQPWSIVLSGLSAIAFVWLITKIVWLTAIVSVFIFLWWFYFLGVYPKAFAKMMLNQDSEKD